MSELKVGQAERRTQNRVIELFREKLGYIFLGNWERTEKTATSKKATFAKVSEKAGLQ